MSPIIDVDLSDAQEPKTLPANTEVKLRIVDCRVDEDKNGNPYILPRFEVVDEPLAKEFSRFLRLPHSGLDAKQMANAKWSLKVFFDCFGIDASRGIDPETIKGKVGWAILGMQEDAEYGEQNTVKRFIAKK